MLQKSQQLRKEHKFHLICFSILQKVLSIRNRKDFFFTISAFYMVVKYPWVKDSRYWSASLVFNLFGVRRTKYFYLFTEEC